MTGALAEKRIIQRMFEVENVTSILNTPEMLMHIWQSIDNTYGSGLGRLAAQDNMSDIEHSFFVNNDGSLGATSFIPPEVGKALWAFSIGGDVDVIDGQDAPGLIDVFCLHSSGADAANLWWKCVYQTAVLKPGTSPALFAGTPNVPAMILAIAKQYKTDGLVP